MCADTHRVEAPHAFEVQRRMSGIRLEELQLLVGQNANGLWQFTVAPPEAGCCVVIQSFRERPARWSARASSARASSLPAFASASSCASHAAASKEVNHSRNVASSLAVRLRISRSSFSTLVIGEEYK